MAAQFTPLEDRAGADDAADVRVLDDFELPDVELADFELPDVELAEVAVVDTLTEEAVLPAAASAARVTEAETVPLAGS